MLEKDKGEEGKNVLQWPKAALLSCVSGDSGSMQSLLLLEAFPDHLPPRRVWEPFCRALGPGPSRAPITLTARLRTVITPARRQAAWGNGGASLAVPGAPARAQCRECVHRLE
ncbi:hypothetical protein P7K49_025775 [Saguinus oedipus]|uniref:Uncharacterized protein n=1 Tax=Saguinus oedipus TaxID=9490 RepID=A0ABQ9UIL3_SAGOE|nr:hypothetical protein P7K49_025775 [Saguinus oedipus]